MEARRGVEFKKTNPRQAWRWGRGPTDVPPDYLVQCQWYMALTGYASWDLCVLIGDDDFRRYPLTRDPELEGLLIDEGQRFWTDHILAKKPPPLDASPEANAYVARQYPQATRPVREATPEEAQLVLDYRAVVAQLDPLEAEKARLATALKAAIGPAHGLTAHGHRATWSPVAGRRETDWQALALSLGATPEQIQQFTTTSAPTRRFVCD